MGSSSLNIFSNRFYYIFFFIANALFFSDFAYSEENSLDLMSDDFDLLEDSSFKVLEAEMDIKDQTLSGIDNESDQGAEEGIALLLEENSGAFSGSINQSFVFGIERPGYGFNRNKRGLERVRTTVNLNHGGEISSDLKYRLGALIRYDWGEWKDDAFLLTKKPLHFELKDAYFDFYPSNNIWVRVGNQIIARGQLDTAKITDTINPRDLSIPGQGELTEFRQHVPAILMSIPISNFKFEFVATYNAGANKLADIGSSFDPLASFQNLVVPGPSSLSANYLRPSNEFEYFASLHHSFNGGDISLVFSDENLNQRTLKDITSTSLSNTLHFGYDRVKMIGISGNLARGHYLLKYEGAQIQGVSIPGQDPSMLPWQNKNQTLLALGSDYTGLDNLTLGIETDAKIVQEYTEDLKGKNTSVGYSIHARWEGLNDLLSINGAISRLNGEKSMISSLAANYNVIDGLSIGGRLVRYQANSVTDSFFPYKNQDVILFYTEYSF